MQKPSPGLIIMALVSPASNNGSDTAPAVITRVWSDTLINVRILLDGCDFTPAQTSVTLHEDEDTARAANTKRIEQLSAAGDDAPRPTPDPQIPPSGAFWPARV